MAAESLRRICVICTREVHGVPALRMFMENLPALYQTSRLVADLCVCVTESVNILNCVAFIFFFFFTSAPIIAESLIRVVLVGPAEQVLG